MTVPRPRSRKPRLGASDTSEAGKFTLENQLRDALNNGDFMLHNSLSRAMEPERLANVIVNQRLPAEWIGAVVGSTDKRRHALAAA